MFNLKPRIPRNSLKFNLQVFPCFPDVRRLFQDPLRFFFGSPPAWEWFFTWSSRLWEDTKTHRPAPEWPSLIRPPRHGCVRASIDDCGSNKLKHHEIGDTYLYIYILCMNIFIHNLSISISQCNITCHRTWKLQHFDFLFKSGQKSWLAWNETT